MIVSKAKSHKYIWPDGTVTYIPEPAIKPTKRIRDKITETIKKYKVDKWQ